MLPTLFALLGCDPDDIETHARLSETVATVVHVSVRTPTDREVYVDFGEDDTYGLRSATAYGHDLDLPLVGMPADTEIHWRLVVDGIVHGDHTITTGSLPSDLPELVATVDHATWSGFVVTTLNGVWQGLVALDRHGRIVWYAEEQGSTSSVIRAVPSVDGAGIVYNTIATDEAPEGSIVFLDWDGQKRRVVRVEGHSHDFMQLDDGTLLAIQRSKQVIDGVVVAGDALVRVAPDSSTIEPLWDAFDWFDPAETGVSEDGDWTHANALGYDPDSDAVRLGLRNLDRIVTIDRASGVMTDVFGEGDWKFIDASRPFRGQHEFQLTPERALIFDNGESSDDTRVVEYALDPEDRTATEIWSQAYALGEWIPALGDVDRLEDGSTLVAWDLRGELQQLTTDGTVLWQVDSSLAGIFGYMRRVSALGGPADESVGTTARRR